MKKFTLGVVAGMSSLAVAVPMLASVAGAQSSSATADVLKDRPIPSQACVQAMADHEGTMLSKIDAMMASHKSIMAEHQKALDAAADIADDTARSEAVQKAHEDMRTAMMAAKNAEGEQTSEMDALKEACGDAMMFKAMHGPGFGMMMKGPGGRHGHGMMKMKMLNRPADAETAPIEIQE